MASICIWGHIFVSGDTSSSVICSGLIGCLLFVPDNTRGDIRSRARFASNGRVPFIMCFPEESSGLDQEVSRRMRSRSSANSGVSRWRPAGIEDTGPRNREAFAGCDSLLARGELPTDRDWKLHQRGLCQRGELPETRRKVATETPARL